MIQLIIFAVLFAAALLILSPFCITPLFNHYPVVRNYLASNNSNDLVVVAGLMSGVCLIVLVAGQFEHEILRNIVAGMYILFTQVTFFLVIMQRMAVNDLRSSRSVRVPLCLLPTYTTGLSYDQRIDAIKRHLRASTAPILGYTEQRQENPIKADFMVRSLDVKKQEVVLEFIDKIPRPSDLKDHVVFLDYACSADMDSKNIDYIARAFLLPKSKMSTLNI